MMMKKKKKKKKKKNISFRVHSLYEVTSLPVWQVLGK